MSRVVQKVCKIRVIKIFFFFWFLLNQIIINEQALNLFYSINKCNLLFDIILATKNHILVLRFIFYIKQKPV